MLLCIWIGNKLLSFIILCMTKVLITGAGSYVGEGVRRYILSTSSDFEIDAV